MKNINPTKPKHHISKPLQLNSVPQSENKLDSILVHGADKIIKHIPRSEFTNNSQNLDQVLETGNTTSKDINLRDNSTNTYTSLFPGQLQLSDNASGDVVINSFYIKIAGEIEGQRYNSFINKYGYNHQAINRGVGLGITTGLTLKTNNAPTGAWGSIKADNIATGPLVLQFPNKIGEFTIATTDDIIGGGSQDLQKTLNNGGTYSYIDGKKSINLNIGQFSGGFGIETILPEMSTSMYANYGSVGISAYHFSTNVGWSISTSLRDGGKFKLEAHSPSGSTTLEFEEQELNTVNAKIKIPRKKIAGDYILATTSDLAIDNLTVTSLSRTELDAIYPNAVNGFRVHCPLITTGALIYEKTATKWLEISTSIVHDPQ